MGITAEQYGTIREENEQLQKKIAQYELMIEMASEVLDLAAERMNQAASVIERQNTTLLKLKAENTALKLNAQQDRTEDDSAA